MEAAELCLCLAALQWQALFQSNDVSAISNKCHFGETMRECIETACASVVDTLWFGSVGVLFIQRLSPSDHSVSCSLSGLMG